MQIFYPAAQERHDPPHEFMEGALTPYNETPARARMILEAVTAAQIGPILPPTDFGLDPILAVHSPAYLEHLRTIYERWVAIGGTAEAALPSVLPPRGNAAFSDSPFATVGYYAFDLSAPVTATTYAAALDSAQCALSAAEALRKGARAAYALCRPPGHHAARELMGGFCYLNNAAIAAQYLRDTGARRVALLDVDVHAGNGTQDLFYDRADVFYASLHGDPAWEYPYFWGAAHERGVGRGLGFTRNVPLPQGLEDAGYLAALDKVLEELRFYAPDYLVLSAGFDTFAGDPLGKLMLSAAAYPQIGARVAALGVPVLVVQEGGYTVSALGQNVVGLLRGVMG